MGYDMKFKVDITGDAPTSEQLADWLEANSRYMKDMEDGADAALDGETITSWDDWQLDMARASAHWPDALIEVTYEGEEFPDHAFAYFKGGKGYWETPKPSFNAEKLHEVTPTVE